MKELSNFSDVTLMMIWGMNQGESDFNAFNSASCSGGNLHPSFLFYIPFTDEVSKSTVSPSGRDSDHLSPPPLLWLGLSLYHLLPRILYSPLNRSFYFYPCSFASILNRAYQVIFRKCKVYQVVVLLEIPHRNPFH